MYVGRQRLLKATLEHTRRLRQRREAFVLWSVALTFVVSLGVLSFSNWAATEGARLQQEYAQKFAPPEVDEATVRVEVRRAQIIFNGRVVAPAKVAEEDEPLEIPELFDALRQLKAQGDDHTQCEVVGSRDVTFGVLKRVMATCAHAGYDDTAFAMMQ